MGNKLIVRLRKVLERSQSGDSTTKSITNASETNSKYPTIETDDGNNSVVDNLGNFTRSANGSVRSTKLSGNKVSLFFSRTVHVNVRHPISLVSLPILR